MSISRDFSIISVLVIDDDNNARSVITAFLKRERYRLFFAANGQEGLDLLETLQEDNGQLPDVVICDIMMPTMDGITFCRTIKAHDLFRHIPVLVLSSLIDVENIAFALDAGADDYLTKPVRSTELRARVRSMIRLRQQYLSLRQSLSVKDEVLRMVASDFVKPISDLERRLNELGELDCDQEQSKPLIGSAQKTIERLQVALDDLQALLAAGN